MTQSRTKDVRTAWEEFEDHLVEWSGRSGVTMEIWALPTDEVAPDVMRAVRASMDEALANVERHSGARLVSVALTVSLRGGLRMTLCDDGVGYPGGSTGRGVAEMMANFAAVGGKLSIRGIPGCGTTITGIIRTCWG